MVPGFGIHFRRTGIGWYCRSRRTFCNHSSSDSAFVENASTVCRSIPAAPSLRRTRSQDARRFFGEYTLSIKLNQTPPFTPFSRAPSIRSVHTVGSVHAHRERASPPCPGPKATDGGFVSLGVTFTIPSSWPLSLHVRYDASQLLCEASVTRRVSCPLRVIPSSCSRPSSRAASSHLMVHAAVGYVLHVRRAPAVGSPLFAVLPR